jgi:hypothetical protein
MIGAGINQLQKRVLVSNKPDSSVASSMLKIDDKGKVRSNKIPVDDIKHRSFKSQKPQSVKGSNTTVPKNAFQTSGSMANKPSSKSLNKHRNSRKTSL